MPCACFSSSTAELLALIYGTVGLQRVQRRRVKNGTLEINDGAPPSCKIHFAGFTLFRMQRHQWHYKALFPVDSVMRVMFAKEIAGRTGGNRYQIGCGVKPGIAMDGIASGCISYTFDEVELLIARRRKKRSVLLTSVLVTVVVQ